MRATHVEIPSRPRSLWPLAAVALTLLPAPGMHNGEALAADAAVGDLSATGPTGTTTLPISLSALASVVGFQFDVVTAPDQATIGFPSVHSPGDHEPGSSELEAGRRRLTVHSPTNAGLPATLEVRVPVTLLPTAPAGGPSVSLENLVFTDATGAAVPVAVNYHTFELWRRQHFSEADRLDPNLIGDDQDPDGDGLVNLGEFFAGTSPRVANPDGAPRPSFTTDPSSGTTRLGLRFWQANTTDDTLANVLGETSQDLLSWSPSPVTVVPTGVTTAVAIELEARVESPATGGPSRTFLRLAFRRLAPTP